MSNQRRKKRGNVGHKSTSFESSSKNVCHSGLFAVLCCGFHPVCGLSHARYRPGVALDWFGIQQTLTHSPGIMPSLGNQLIQSIKDARFLSSSITPRPTTKQPIPLKFSAANANNVNINVTAQAHGRAVLNTPL